MEGRLDVETSNRPCGRISRSLAFAATGKGEAWTRHSKGPKPLRRTPMSNSPARRERPPVLNPLNRRIRTRMSGGVGGGSREVSPYPDFQPARFPAKWMPVGVKKTRRNQEIEPPFRFNRNGKG